MDKKLFNEYEKWCVENNKDPFEEGSVSGFKSFMDETKRKEREESMNEKRNELVSKQKEIFGLLQDYVGVKVEYRDYMFEPLDSVIRAVMCATVEINHNGDADSMIGKIIG